MKDESHSHRQLENLDPIPESSLGCMQGIVLCLKKLHFVSLYGTGVRKISSVAFRFSSIKIHFSVNSINEVYVFSIKYRYFIEKNIIFIYSILWNVVLPFVSLQSTLLLYWPGFCDVSITLCDSIKLDLNVHPRSNFMELAEKVLIESQVVVMVPRVRHPGTTCHSDNLNNNNCPIKFVLLCLLVSSGDNLC